MINELFTVKSLSDKATLLQTGAYKPAENLDEINLSGLDLFKVNHFLLIISNSYSRSMIETRMVSLKLMSIFNVSRTVRLNLQSQRLLLLVLVQI